MKLTNRKHNTNNPTCKYANMGIAYAFWVMILSVKVTILGDKNVLQKTATGIRKKGYFDPRTSTAANTESHKPRVRYIWYTTVDKATMLYIYFTCILWLGRWTKVVQSVTRTCYSNWQIQRKPFPRHTFLGANDAFYFTLCPPSLRYSINTARVMHMCTCASMAIGGDTLIPGPFDYVTAQSVSEAVSLLAQHGDDAKILAGGHSLIPILRYRLASPAVLIDINRITALEYIHEADGMLHIGALTRESALTSSTLIRNRYPILDDTARMIADPLVRNWATVGGNIAHADPANDHPATMLALSAQFVAQGPTGQRVIPADEFFGEASFEITLQSGEILTEVRLPRPEARSGGAYLKLERKVGDYAIAGVAAYVCLDASGLVTYAGIGLTNVGPAPIKARAAEKALLGQPLNESTIRQAADLAVAASQPSSDTRGPAEYKRAMVHTLCTRALKQAHTRAKGGA